MGKILVVDLCDTLYKSNTTQDFFYYAFLNDEKYKILKRKNSTLNFKLINKISNKILKHDMSRVLITKILKDKTLEEIEKLVIRFIEDYLEPLKIIKVHKIVEKYKKRGYKIIIVTASYDFIAEKIAFKLGYDDYIASKAKVSNGYFTGKVSSDILYTKFNVFKEKYSCNSDLVMITDNTTDYEFAKKTQKSYIVLNKYNKDFWKRKKENKFIFLEE